MKRTSFPVLLFMLALLIALSSMHLFGLQAQGISNRLVFWEFQIPRLLSAVLAGAGLSLSGLLMQNLFQNPMAGPYVLGINSGASLLISILILGAGPSVLNQLSYASHC
jgi:ABC-type Fe3+-siderophore transport system permease subunit